MKSLFVVAAVTVLFAAILFAVAYFHLPDAFAASALGVVIGMGVALAIVSFASKGRARSASRQRDFD